MHKKIVFSLIALLCFLQQSLVVAQLVTTDEKSKEQEPFPLVLLPQDVQHLIISYMWDIVDTKEQFRTIAAQFNNNKTLQSQRATYDPRTSWSEQRKYGFSGKKTPIYFYTLKNNKPYISEVGYIIEDAWPYRLNISAKISYYSYNSMKNRQPTTCIFLNGPSTTYGTILANNIINNKKNIIGCSLSVHGDLAIAYWDNNGSHITYTDLDEVKKDQPIDLEKNKALSILDNDFDHYRLNTVLFNHQGTLLACVYNHTDQSAQLLQDNEHHTILQRMEHILAPRNTPLTSEQIGKRILHIPTPEIKALVKQGKEQKKKNSWLSFSGFFSKK